MNFQKDILYFFTALSGYIWGLPLIILLLGTGIYLTVILRGIQFRALFPSLYLALVRRKEDGDQEGDISHFEALMTALSATVGVGNIAGVATAIAIGGPGAIFWMWITGLVGMATKYSEALLAVKYRTTDGYGLMSGGPMYYISQGLGMKRMALLFAVFASVSAFGIGNMVQSNSVADALNSAFGVDYWITGLVICIATGLVLLGGIKSIARVTSHVVPVMICLYIAGAITVILSNWSDVPDAFGLIFHHAFNPTSAAGGFVGSTISQTLRIGVARGIFSNESGLGSSPIAAAAARTKGPVKQALVSMTQTFIDTIVVCTFTGLAIITSGVWDSGETGAALSSLAFENDIPLYLGAEIIAISLAFFAYSTILGWSYYGEKSIQYIFGDRTIVPYRVLFTVFVFIGAVIKLDLVWAFADVMNGLMAFPNLLALIGLSKVISSETKLHLEDRITG